MMTKYNISIDCAKIDKLKIKYTDKGQAFANFDLIIRDEVDSYGNIGFIVQQQSKEEREQQVKLPILGNAKRVEKRVEVQPQHQSEFKPLPSAPKHNEEKYYQKEPPVPKEKVAKVEPIVTEFYQHKGSQVEWDSVKQPIVQTTIPPEQTRLNMPQGERPNSLFKDAAGDLPF